MLCLLFQFLIFLRAYVHVLLADAVIERNVCCVVSVMFLATPMLVGIVHHTVLCTGKLTIIIFTFKIKI